MASAEVAWPLRLGGGRLLGVLTSCLRAHPARSASRVEPAPSASRGRACFLLDHREAGELLQPPRSTLQPVPAQRPILQPVPASAHPGSVCGQLLGQWSLLAGCLPDCIQTRALEPGLRRGGSGLGNGAHLHHVKRENVSDSKQHHFLSQPIKMLSFHLFRKSVLLGQP